MKVLSVLHRSSATTRPPSSSTIRIRAGLSIMLPVTSSLGPNLSGGRRALICSSSSYSRGLARSLGIKDAAVQMSSASSPVIGGESCCRRK